MRIKFADSEIRVFTISPRTLGVDTYWSDVCQTIRWSEEYKCSGMLIFTGNDVYIEPWLVAQLLLERTKSLVPLVAVNPIYVHPFTAARMVASLTHLYQRRIYLNMVTGTALNHMEALGDCLTHDERYARMQEYILIIKSLTGSTKPFSMTGRFYKLKNAVLPAGMAPELCPEFVLAGQSSAAREICGRTGATGMQMLSSKLENGVGDASGIHFGLVTRPQKDEAWMVADRLFPARAEDRAVLDLSMRNTDSVWKLRMKYEADQPNVAESGYWLEPFRNCKADCPYFTGSYQQAAVLISGLIRGGIKMFILDIPATEEEYYHISQAFKLAEHDLCSQGKQVTPAVLAT